MDKLLRKSPIGKLTSAHAKGSQANGSVARKSPSSRSGDDFTATKQLPKGFADELFNYEMEVEKDNVDIEVVNKLLNLYAIAIEVFESQKNERYLIFKNKTQQLLMRANVTRAMNNALEVKQKSEQQLVSQKVTSTVIPNNNTSSQAIVQPFDREEQQRYQQQLERQEQEQRERRKKLEEQEYIQLVRSQKIKELRLNMQYIYQQCDTEGLQRVIESHKREKEQFNRLVQKDVMSQNERIQQRIAQRKAGRKKSTGSLSEQDLQQAREAAAMDKDSDGATELLSEANAYAYQYDAAEGLTTEPIAEHVEEDEESPAIMRHPLSQSEIFIGASPVASVLRKQQQSRAQKSKPAQFGLEEIDFQNGKLRKPVVKVDLFDNDLGNEDVLQFEVQPAQNIKNGVYETPERIESAKPTTHVVKQFEQEGSQGTSNSVSPNKPSSNGTPLGAKKKKSKRTSQTTRNKDATQFYIPF